MRISPPDHISLLSAFFAWRKVEERASDAAKRCVESVQVDFCNKMEIDQQEVDAAKVVHEVIRGASIQVQGGGSAD